GLEVFGFLVLIVGDDGGHESESDAQAHQCTPHAKLLSLQTLGETIPTPQVGKPRTMSAKLVPDRLESLPRPMRPSRPDLITPFTGSCDLPVVYRTPPWSSGCESWSSTQLRTV